MIILCSHNPESAAAEIMRSTTRDDMIAANWAPNHFTPVVYLVAESIPQQVTSTPPDEEEPPAIVTEGVLQDLSPIPQLGRLWSSSARAHQHAVQESAGGETNVGDGWKTEDEAQVEDATTVAGHCCRQSVYLHYLLRRFCRQLDSLLQVSWVGT